MKLKYNKKQLNRIAKQYNKYVEENATAPAGVAIELIDYATTEKQQQRVHEKAIKYGYVLEESNDNYNLYILWLQNTPTVKLTVFKTIY